MTPDAAKSLVTAMWVVGTAIVAAVAWLSVLVFKAGSKLARFEAAADKIEKACERLERIPIIEVKVDQLAEAQTEDRRRVNSLIPPIQEKVTTLWEKVFSLSEWRKSRPNINGSGHGE